MVVPRTAVNAANAVAIVAEVGQRTVGRDDQFVAVGASKPVLAARSRGEDVVRVHAAQDEMASIPALSAAATREAALPAFEAGHADSVEELRSLVNAHLYRTGVVLPRRQEQGTVHERVPVEDVHRRVAHDARDPGHLVGGQRGQDEAANVVAAAFVFHLDVVRVDLVPGKRVERGVVLAPAEQAAGAVAFAVGKKRWRTLFGVRRRRRELGRRTGRTAGGTRARHA